MSLRSDEIAGLVAIILTLIIVAVLEINAIKGKTGPMTSVKAVIHCSIGLLAVFNAIKGKTGPITSVSGVIHSSVWLTAALVLIVEFL